MKVIRIGLVASGIALILGLASCSKDHTVAAPVTVKFNNNVLSYGEDQGAQGIGITLSAVQKTDVVVPFTWTSPDTTAFLGADFTFNSTTTSSVTIPAGSTTASILINIIDDAQIDGTNKLKFNLTATGLTGAILPTDTTSTSCNLKILDNDVATAGQLQADLYWFTANTTASINSENLYLIFQQNVVYHDTTTTADGTYAVITDQGTSLHTYVANTAGYAQSGFQTAFLTSADADQKYFIFVPYVKGTSQVYFYIVLNGLGRTNDFLSGEFTTTYIPTSAGSYFSYFGPFLKQSGNFDFTTRASSAATAKQLKLMKSQYWNHQ